MSQMRNSRILAAIAALGLSGLGAIHAATWDTSGNGMLKGPYYVRQVLYYSPDRYGDLGGLETHYGTLTFDGNGNYSGTLTYYVPGLGETARTATATGTYSIASSGYGFIGYPCFVPLTVTSWTVPVNAPATSPIARR